MKKGYFFFLAVMILVDICLSLLMNVDLLDKQEQLVQLQEKATRLTAENEHLKREVAQLSSLNRIAKLASEMGLVRDKQRLVVVTQDQFAWR